MNLSPLLLAALDLPEATPPGFNFSDTLLAFFAIVLEGAPFVLLGAVISGLLDVLLPAGWIKSCLPRNKFIGIFAAIGFGMIFPLCECGAMPIVQRLIRKGIPASVATTYLLAAPALNPLALLSTWLAFRNQNPLEMVLLRFSLSLLVLIFLGVWLARLRPEQIVRPELLLGETFRKKSQNSKTEPIADLVQEPCRDFASSRVLQLQNFTGAVTRDFLGVLLFLMIGAAVAAVFSTQVNRNLLAPVGQNLVLGPVAGIFLAQVLCLCSTTDAFIIATFAPFSTAAKIAFLVAGPLIDFKLYWLYRSAFLARFVHRLWARALVATFLLVLLYSVVRIHLT